MFRKKRIPSPLFRMPGAPLAPIKGQHAPVGRQQRKGTTLAVFQVVQSDTHENYVACRGFEAQTDLDFVYAHDPHAYPGTTPINVAKPYSIRGLFPYRTGQVLVAARIHTRFGENQGKASVTTGQPASLNEEIEMLLDDGGVAISWLDISSSPSSQQLLGVPFINLSDETIPASGIMDWVGDTNIDGIPHVRCFKPGPTFSRRWLVNGQTPVLQGDTGLGSWLDDLSGFAAIDPGSVWLMGSNTGWGPYPGSWLLYPYLYGFTQVGSQFYVMEDGGLAVHFRQEEVTHLKVKMLENLQAGSFTTGAHMARNGLGQFVESPFTTTIVFRDGGYLRPGEFIASNRSEPIIADIEWMGGFWELTNAQCEPEETSPGTYTPGGGSMALHQFAPPDSPASPAMAIGG